MPGVIVGLDIGEGAVSGVRVKSGLRGLELLGAGRVTFSPDEELGAALARLSEHLDLTCDVSAASLPASLFSFRNLSLPFSDLKKVRQTLGFELESMTARPMDEMLVDFSAYERKQGSRILAALLPGEVISGRLGALDSVRLDPDVLTIGWLPVLSWLLKRPGAPDQGLFFELGEERSVIYAFLNKKLALVRDVSGAKRPPWAQAAGYVPEAGDAASDYLSFLAESLADTLHSFAHMQGAPISPEKLFAAGPGASYPGFMSGLAKVTGIECEAVDLMRDGAVKTGKQQEELPAAALLQGALALALRAGLKGEEFNFRKDGFAKAQDHLGIRKNALKGVIMIGILATFLLANMWVEYGFLIKKYDALGAAVNGLYSKTFPDAKRIVDPLGQMKIALNEAAKDAGGDAAVSKGLVIAILKDISSRIPPSFEMRITRLLIDRETVRITGRTDTFNTVNSIKGRLEPSQFYESVTISSATLDQTGKAVQFEMQLKRARR